MNVQFLICTGSILWHKDRQSSTCFIIPVKIQKSAIFAVEESQRNIKELNIYRFNDWHRHALLLPQTNSKAYLIHIDMDF